MAEKCQCDNDFLYSTDDDPGEAINLWCPVMVEMRLLCHTEVNSWDMHPIRENFENLVFNLVHSDSDAFFSLSGQFTTFLPFSRHFRTIQTRSLM